MLERRSQRRSREQFGNGSELTIIKLFGCARRMKSTMRITSTSTRASASSQTLLWTGCISILKVRSSSQPFYTFPIAHPSNSTTITTLAKMRWDSMSEECSSLNNMLNSSPNIFPLCLEWSIPMISRSTSIERPFNRPKASRSSINVSLRRFLIWSQKSQPGKTSLKMNTNKNLRKILRSWLWWTSKSWQKRRKLPRRNFSRNARPDMKSSTKSLAKLSSWVSSRTRRTARNLHLFQGGTPQRVKLWSPLTSTSGAWSQFRTKFTSSVVRTGQFFKNLPLWSVWFARDMRCCSAMTPSTNTSSTCFVSMKER